MAIDAAQLMVRVGADTADAERGLDSFSGKMSGVSKSAGMMGGLLTAGVTLPVLAIGKQALTSAADFEQSMNIMQQVTGATSGEMGLMNAQALQLGAETSFSAGEAAGAMLELGKAGMNAEQIMASIAGVMDLAAAGGVSLGSAAAVTASALNTFGLEASQSGYVANLLAAAANASAADISDLGAGMQQAGFAFSASNQTVDDLAASLAILTNVGLTGADSGTALKNAFIRMMDPTAEAAGVMDELGISFYDAQGQMRPLPEIIGNLNAGMTGLTQEQRNSALSTIFLSDGMKAMIPLLDAGQSGFMEMKEAVNQQGAASSTSAARMSGLSGALEYFGGSVDSFLIGAAQPFLGMLGDMVRWVADLVTQFGTMPAGLQNGVMAFAAVLAAAGPVLLIISGVAAALAFLASPVGLVVAASAALAAAWAADFGGIQGKTAAVWGAIQPLFAALAGWLQTEAPAALAAFQAVWASGWAAVEAFFAPVMSRLAYGWSNMVEGFLGLGPKLATVGAAWTTAFGVIQGKMAELWAIVQPIFAALGGWLQAEAPGALAAFQAGWASAFGIVQSKTAAVLAAVAPLLATLGGWLQAEGPGALTAFGAQWASGWAAIQAIFTPVFARLGEAWGTMIAGFSELGPKFGQMAAAAEGPLNQIMELGKLVGAMLVVSMNFAGNTIAAIMSRLPDIAGVVLDEITALITLVGTTVESVVKIVSAILSGDWATAWEGAKELFSGFATFFLTTSENLGALLGIVYGAMKEAIINTFADFGTDITGSVVEVEEKVKTFWAWLTGLTWGDITAGVSEGFTAAVDALVGWAWPVLSDLTDWEWPSLAGLTDWEWPGLPEWKWPDIQPPKWMGGLLDRADATQDKIKEFFDNIGGNADGTPNWRGGLTWVGEEGPELVNLPGGARIFDAQNSAQLAASGGMAGGGGNITIYATVANDIDLNELAMRIAQAQRRRG